MFVLKSNFVVGVAPLCLKHTALCCNFLKSPFLLGIIWHGINSWSLSRWCQPLLRIDTGGFTQNTCFFLKKKGKQKYFRTVLGLFKVMSRLVLPFFLLQLYINQICFDLESYYFICSLKKQVFTVNALVRTHIRTQNSLLPYHVGYSEGEWNVGIPFCLHGLLPILTNQQSYWAHIGTLRFSLANSKLWLLLSNALDASKNAENTGVPLFTQ